ncbi:hypothetical protein [Bacillus sp. SG20001]|uniref:hypothetical protein n=1 Tax=Bacillus TaxID=1386 RepID=UPI00288042BB|nr:hypothetical protein [Bacillus sp. SG20001]WNF51259.1 hypothetical protein RHP70_02205 [Bacillus sp. SG20001]
MNTYNITYLYWEVLFQTKYPTLVDWIEDYFSNEKIIRDVEQVKLKNKWIITYDDNQTIYDYLTENIKEYHKVTVENQVFYVSIRKRQKVINIVSSDYLSHNINNTIDYFVMRIIRTLIQIFAKNDGYTFFHAAFAEINGKGIAVTGDKFAGKSTTLINLLQMFTGIFVSNDKLAIKGNADGRMNVISFPIAAGFRVGTILKKFNSVRLTNNRTDNQEFFSKFDPLSQKEIAMDEEIDKCDIKLYLSIKEISQLLNVNFKFESKVDVIINPCYNRKLKKISINELKGKQRDQFLNSQILDTICSEYLFLEKKLLLGTNSNNLKVQESVPIYMLGYNESLESEFRDFIEGKLLNHDC